MNLILQIKNFFLKIKYKNIHNKVKTLKYGDEFYYHIENYKEMNFAAGHQNRPFIFIKYEFPYIYCFFQTRKKQYGTKTNKFYTYINNEKESYVFLNQIFVLHIKDFIDKKNNSFNKEILDELTRSYAKYKFSNKVIDANHINKDIKDNLLVKKYDVVSLKEKSYIVNKVNEDNLEVFRLYKNKNEECVMLQSHKYFNPNEKLYIEKECYLINTLKKEQIKILENQLRDYYKEGDMICLNDNKYILYAFDYVLATLYPIVKDKKEYFIHVSKDEYLDIKNPIVIKKELINKYEKLDGSLVERIKKAKARYKKEHQVAKEIDSKKIKVKKSWLERLNEQLSTNYSIKSSYKNTFPDVFISENEYDLIDDFKYKICFDFDAFENRYLFEFYNYEYEKYESKYIVIDISSISVIKDILHMHSNKVSEEFEIYEISYLDFCLICEKIELIINNCNDQSLIFFLKAFIWYFKEYKDFNHIDNNRIIEMRIV